MPNMFTYATKVAGWFVYHFLMRFCIFDSHIMLIDIPEVKMSNEYISNPNVNIQEIY